MIGILLITHGTFGESLIQNVCQVLGNRPPLIGQLGVAAQDDPLGMLPVARLRLKEVDDGDGVQMCIRDRNNRFDTLQALMTCGSLSYSIRSLR